MEKLLELKDLKKYFKTPGGMLHAVDGVSLTMDAGTTLGVVGESGCGKSTLGRVVLGLLGTTGGTVEFCGEDITDAARARRKALRRDMQIIFQDPFSSLDPRNTVAKIIAEPLNVFKVYPNKADRDARVRELMMIVGLADRFANSYPHELDGGRRQRIGVARALALNPKFIVCDEPVSALDVSIQAQILNLLQDLQEQFGMAYMFITHDLSVVKHISKQILVMYVGKMVEKCPPDELFEQPLHPYTKGLISAIPVPDLDARKDRILLTGELSSPIDPKPSCRFCTRCPYAKEMCSSTEPQWEEALPGHFVACHYVREINKLS